MRHLFYPKYFHWIFFMRRSKGTLKEEVGCVISLMHHLRSRNTQVYAQKWNCKQKPTKFFFFFSSTVFLYWNQTMLETKETEKLRILHQSKHFIVIDKPFDVIINSDEADRVSVHSLLKDQFPDLTNDNLKVSKYCFSTNKLKAA